MTIDREFEWNLRRAMADRFDSMELGVPLADAAAAAEAAARLVTPVAWKTNTFMLPVSNEMLIDFGLIPDPVHRAWAWPKLVPFPRIDRATKRATHLRDEVRRRVHLAYTALTDPDDLDREGEDW